MFFRFAKSTEKKALWASRVFDDWRENRNKLSLNTQKPIPNLLDLTNEDMCQELRKFLLECRKQDGSEYPSDTLYELLMSIQMFLHINGKNVKFLNEDEFLPLKHTLDNRMKDLSAKGHVKKRKQADIMTYEEEELLWDSGELGSKNPQQLLNTVLYLFGIHFALRAGQEHRNLRFIRSQIQLKCDKSGKEYLLYTEDMSKNQQGGLQQRKLTPKQVRAYENSENKSRCIVALYKLYLNKRPPGEIEAFYLRPLVKPKNDIWYRPVAIGKNTISKVVSRMCASAGLGGYRTNHSLRATSATRLFGEEFDEQLICETTGHRSTSVRSYKRTSDHQHKAISATLYGKPSTSTCSSRPTPENNPVTKLDTVEDAGSSVNAIKPDVETPKSEGTLSANSPIKSEITTSSGKNVTFVFNLY